MKIEIKELTPASAFTPIGDEPDWGIFCGHGCNGNWGIFCGTDCRANAKN